MIYAILTNGQISFQNGRHRGQRREEMEVKGKGRKGRDGMEIVDNSNALRCALI